MILQHKTVKNYPIEVERVFVGRDHEERIFITFTYEGQFKRANRWTGLKVNCSPIKASDLRHLKVNETYYRLVAKSGITISWIYGKKELFKTLQDLGYKLPTPKLPTL